MTKNKVALDSSVSDTAHSQTKIKVGRPKNTQKKQQILHAASSLFLKQGFSSSSMDNVAQQAGVSKQTVYSHFANKEALFTAAIQHKVNQYQLDDQTTPCESLPLQERLNHIALHFLHLLQDPEAIAMYRIVIGELQTSTRAAELFYEAGPKHSINMLTDLLDSSRNKDMNKEQVKTVAIEFFNLLKGEYNMKSMLGLDYKLNNAQEQALADSAVEHVIAKIS